ncbi:MAG: metallophosphoesterase [Gemmatimonadota bacterium]
MPNSVAPSVAAQVQEAAQDTRYQTQVQEELTSAYTLAYDAAPIDANMSRLIIFSDHHKGARNGADDFRKCERAYLAALAYYYALGYTLIELGDVEELWEEQPKKVLKTYQYVMEMSARFQTAGRYFRIWGNHDDIWSFDDKVKSLPHKLYGAGLIVHEGVRMQVAAGNQVLGELFLTHGHQGTGTSDKWSKWSRIPVRYFWRNLQRVFKWSLNTPARDWVLREKHNIAMHSWARLQQNVVLLAGHTHRPVFKSETHADKVVAELAAAQAALAAKPQDEALQVAVASLAAELEWIRAQEQGEKGPVGTVRMDKLCYFNTGCCSYIDGDITGIEIARGNISLIRWPNDDEKPKPQVLETQPIRSLFC